MKLKKTSIIFCIIMAIIIAFPTSAFAYTNNSINSNFEQVSPHYILAIYDVTVICGRRQQ